MKRTSIILVFALICSLGLFAQKSTKATLPKPLTQYCMVCIIDDGLGVGLRDAAQMSRLLKSLGFKVTIYDRPETEDEMETYTALTASRKEPGGLTKVKLEGGEDIVCTIDFASQQGVNKFVESMMKSGYTKDGTLFSHAKNNISKILVRVRGLKVKIINPFEMPPLDF